MKAIILKNFDFNTLNILFDSTGVLLTIFTSLAARNYIKSKQKWYHLLTLVYVVSFSLLIFTTNWFVFITAWEIVTLATALMLLWQDRKIARQYFIIQFIGSSFLLYIILLAISRGYQELGFISEVWLQNLFIFGVGVKSAIFGVHFWLAPVHSRAPSPVSAILSGWVVKLGLITMLKLIPEGNTLLIYLGFIMIFYGGIKALLSTDYKVLLAFSTISQLGFIALAIGQGSLLAYLGAVFHIIAHGLAKTTLFIGSGYWLKEYGARSIYRFTSALKRQGLNSIITILAFASLMGMPLMAGYNSKYLVKHCYEGGNLLILLHLASLVTVLYCLRFLKLGILENQETNNKTDTISNYSLGWGERASLIPAILLLLGLGTFPGFMLNILGENTCNFHLLGGIRDFLIYLVIGSGLLYSLGWVRVEEKPPPSLNKYFRKSYNFIYSLSARTREFDSDTFFENYLYQKIYNSARELYRQLFVGFQLQLLLIPLFLLLILLWKFIFI